MNPQNDEREETYMMKKAEFINYLVSPWIRMYQYRILDPVLMALKHWLLQLRLWPRLDNSLCEEQNNIGTKPSTLYL